MTNELTQWNQEPYKGTRTVAVWEYRVTSVQAIQWIGTRYEVYLLCAPSCLGVFVANF